MLSPVRVNADGDMAIGRTSCSRGASALNELVAQSCSGEGPAPELATRALEECGEREAIILADWNPARRPPKLRIVGTAT